MSYKQKICNRIIEKMEWWRDAQWADHIDKQTKDAVITVMENVVDGVANNKQVKYKDVGDCWILCSNQLPGEDENVLVSVYFSGDKDSNIKPSYYVDIASQIDGCWSSYSDEYKVYASRHKVFAWKPLPKPYKG